MPPYHAHADPPRTLTVRLQQLNDNLQALGERLKISIAGVVGDAIAEAVRDAVRKLLGSKEWPPLEQDRLSHGHYRDDREDDPWGDEDRRWSRDDDEVYPAVRETPATSNRWRNALSAALQTALWFLKQQPRRRPVLTTVCVTLAAGVTAFVAGPVLAAGAGVLASVAGLILTAESSKSAAEIAAG